MLVVSTCSDSPVPLSGNAGCLPRVPVPQGYCARECVGSCSVGGGEVARLLQLEGAELRSTQDLTGRGIVFSQNVAGGRVRRLGKSQCSRVRELGQFVPWGACA